MHVSPPSNRWTQIREALQNTARLPLIVLVVFLSSMIAWLGIWAAWRASEYVFQTYLSESWIGP